MLECIRRRHGLTEFAGGRLLLDPEYENEHGESATSATASEDENRERRGLLFPGLRLLHAEPIVIGVDDFFTPDECDDYVARSASPPMREYVSRAGMGPFEQPAALDSAEVRHVSVCGARKARAICRLELFIRAHSFENRRNKAASRVRRKRVFGTIGSREHGLRQHVYVCRRLLGAPVTCG